MARRAAGPAEVDDKRASFSNFSHEADDDGHAVAAPGVCIRSTWPGGGYATLSGTSMAAPHVAGLVALCMGEGGAGGPCSGLAPAQVIQKIRADAQAQATAANGFQGDPLQPLGRYFGHLASAAATTGLTLRAPERRRRLGSASGGHAGAARRPPARSSGSCAATATSSPAAPARASATAPCASTGTCASSASAAERSLTRAYNRSRFRRAKCCGGTGAFQAPRAGSIPVARSPIRLLRRRGGGYPEVATGRSAVW